jgi:hypothetical protein
MCKNCAGTRISETRGDGTKWEYVIDENGTRIGSMVGHVRDDYLERGYTYSAHTGRWTQPEEPMVFDKWGKPIVQDD